MYKYAATLACPDDRKSQSKRRESQILRSTSTPEQRRIAKTLITTPEFGKSFFVAIESWLQTR
jgi:hypothetical protein